MKQRPRHISQVWHGRPARGCGADLWRGHPAHVSGRSFRQRSQHDRQWKIENRKSKIENLRQAGFSLTEVLLAAGILVIGFLLISSTLPIGIHLTARGTERAIAAVAADEAFAKVRLFGIEPVEDWPAIVNLPASFVADPNVMHVDYSEITRRHPITRFTIITPDDFAYPSTDIRPEVKKYYWSALLRYNYEDSLRRDDSFQATVFVSRSPGAGVQYPLFDRLGRLPVNSPYPRPVLIPVKPWNNVAGPTDKICILDPNDPELRFQMVTEDSVLVDDRTGQIMQVIKRDAGDPSVFYLDGRVFNSDLNGDNTPDPMRYAWVVPPAVGGGRYPCVGVYQKVITFNKTP